MNRRTSSATLSLLLLFSAAAAHAIDAGVARLDVTPSEPIRLTGYGNRKTNSVGVQQKLWAKALALGSDRDGPAILITLDNCGIAESTYRELVARLAKRTKLRQAGMVIACSHTHSGPCTTDWAPNIFASDIPAEQQAVLDRYTRGLIATLEQVALAALADRRPAQLAWAQGEVGFARNRRVVVGRTAQFGDNAAGPVDHALPVLRVTDPDGTLRAVVANYACHCTTLGGEFNHVCGDWAGYAQEAIERDQPGAVSLITIGCGADANPSPRGGADFGLDLAKRHGEELAAEVKRLLGLTFTPLPGKLTTQLKEIRLPFGPQFTRDEWQTRATNSGIDGYHAKKWLSRLDRGEKPPDSLYYPISSWRFGDELALVFLPGEVVVDYALRLKREFDPARLWVSSYSHYVPCYIPSRRILAEGGYEAESSLWYYDRPTRLSTNAEDLIIKTVHALLPKQFLFDKRKAEFPDPKTPQQALGTFRTKAEFTIELVASEPLIESPVAIDWDAQGRLWVCEMYDYPTGIHPPADTGRKWGENPPAHPGGYKPGGRIKVLESTKHDGHYDKATLFLDGLPFPTGVMPWRRGALICAAPDILYAEDTDGDGRADVVRTNYTGFATHNFQARVNGFRWGLDGWLHGSSGLFGGKVRSLLTGKEVDLGGRDFRIKPDTGEIEPLAGVSQMGRVRDDFDNWFGNDNSTLLWHYPLPERYMRRNAHATYPDPRVNVAARSANDEFRMTNGRTNASGERTLHSSFGIRHSDPNRLYPISRTLERFNSPESVNRVTSACGIDIYRDVLLGTNYYGNAFICEPVHNLVTRLLLEPEGVTFAGHRATEEEHGEFLASTDNWFRPVQVRTGPDGALWVVDMYRAVIEHPRWIAPDRLKELDVRAGADMGRIYRVYPKRATLRPLGDLTSLNERQLADAFDTSNGTTRDLVHQQLSERKGARNSDAILKLARGADSAAVRAQALSVLGVLKPPLESNSVARLRDSRPEVQRIAMWQCEPLLARGSTLPPPFAFDMTSTFLSLATPADMRGGAQASPGVGASSDPRVRFQFALSLGESPEPKAAAALARFAVAWADDAWLRAAALTSADKWATNALEDALKLDASRSGRSALLRGVFAAVAARDDVPILQKLWPPGTRPQPEEAAMSRLQDLALCLDAMERSRVDWPQLPGPEKESLHQAQTSAKALAAESRSDNVRAAAFSVLARGPPQGEGIIRFFIDQLAAGLPPAAQQAVLQSLQRNGSPETATQLLDHWRRFGPALRSSLLKVLLTRESWTRSILAAVEKQEISVSEIGTVERQRLLKNDNPAVRADAERILRDRPSVNRASVLAGFKGVAKLSPAPDAGAPLFDTHCAPCHAFRGHGHAVGPNLAEFAGKSAADFLLAILDPNAAINPNFLAYNIDTRDGRSLTGIVRGETASGLTLVQGGGTEENIQRSEVKEIRASQISLMPEGLEKVLTPQNLADLIAWLKQGAPAPFGHASANPELAAKNRADFLNSNPSSVAKIVAASETLPYRSWIGTLPMDYCRQSAGVNRLAWESLTPSKPRGSRHEEAHTPPNASQSILTLAAPVRAEEHPVTFRFPAAMGFASQPQGRFTLHINGQPVLDFDVALADAALSSADGRVRMSYAVKEANSEDSNGVLAIEVAAALLKAGHPTRFEVTGSASNSQRWFGVYSMEH